MTAAPVVRVAGVAAPLLRDNIDTDLIIPSRAIRMGKQGLGASLFAAWRYSNQSRQENPEFVLNRKPYRHATILVGGSNFGCGSFREAAVWALRDFGIRGVIAESFGNIFYTNCITNGLIPVVLDRNTVHRLALETERAEGQQSICIDIESCTVHLFDRSVVPFNLPSLYRTMLLRGLNMIDVVLERETEVVAYERRSRAERPWTAPLRQRDRDTAGQ
jgi:3-isopropylmalate/(R)-2-methylmalate dehydratase small subunit